MDFPKRIQQHKNESDSFAIIQYKLKDIGIIRAMTDHDYGIDFEIEVVNGTSVQGKTIKVQLKSSDDLNVRQSDGKATVGGIKQSTFNYWASLSYSVPVIGMAVDLSSEDIYVSEPLFFQSITSIKGNGDNSTGTIDFQPFHYTEDIIKYLHSIVDSYDLRGGFYALRWIVGNFRKIMDFYYNAEGCDFFLEIDEPEELQTILENSNNLLMLSLTSGLIKSDNVNFDTFKYSYYAKMNDGYTPSYQSVIDGFKQMLPTLVIILRIIKEKMENSFYYWLNNDLDLLNIVERTFIPNPKDVITDKYGNTDKYWPQVYEVSDYGPLSYLVEQKGIDEKEFNKILFSTKSPVSFSYWMPIKDE